MVKMQNICFHIATTMYCIHSVFITIVIIIIIIIIM